MNATTTLTGSPLRTYQRIFQHPISHNLKWQDVHALFRELGQVDTGPNGDHKVTCNGQSMILPAGRTKDVGSTDEVMALRHFLERTGTNLPEMPGDETHWLLVIDHHEARIFQSPVRGTVPQQILPHEPDDYFRHAHHSKDFSRGMEKPDPNSFFEPVADALQADGPILVFGAGTGMSSEMDQFIAWVKQHRPAVAARVIGTLVVDEHHLTTDQLLAKSREFYASRPRHLP
jgi:hypothetical protein